MKIRPATREDTNVLAALKQTVHDLHATTRPDFFKFHTDEGAKAEFEQLFERENVRILLASSERTPIGYMVLFIVNRPEDALRMARKTLYIDQISVKEEYQGRGCGKALIEAAKALARESKLDRVELDFWSFNERARRFFASQGFVTITEKMALELEPIQLSV